MHQKIISLFHFPILLAAVFVSFHLWPAHGMNNDGQPDILWRNYGAGNGGINDIWTMSGSTQTGTLSLTAATDVNWKMIATADFNGDGQLDILWYYIGGGTYAGHIAYWYMNGNSLVSAIDLVSASPSIYQTDPATWELVGAGYFGEGVDFRPDLLWYNKITGELAVWHMNGSSYVSAGYLVNSSGVRVTAPPPWKVVAVTYLWGSSTSDIYFRNTSTGQNAAWEMTGVTYTMSWYLTANTDLSWDIVGADYFTPGFFSDLVWKHSGTGAVVIWTMNPTDWLSTVPQTTRDVNWRVGATGDAKIDILDQDGLPDLWERNNFGHLGEGPYGDWDGDGKSNLEEYLSGTSPTDAVGLQLFTPSK